MIYSTRSAGTFSLRGKAITLHVVVFPDGRTPLTQKVVGREQQHGVLQPVVLPLPRQQSGAGHGEQHGQEGAVDEVQ